MNFMLVLAEGLVGIDTLLVDEGDRGGGLEVDFCDYNSAAFARGTEWL
jgi:hypothetical protein